jgi:hypothetical protein
MELLEQQRQAVQPNVWQEAVSARAAMNDQDLVCQRMQRRGIDAEPTWRIEEDRVSRVLSGSDAGISESHSVEMSRRVAERFLAQEPRTERFLATMEGARQDSTPNVRFPCGSTWYTLKHPLAPDTLTRLALDLGLEVSARPDDIEKQLHFRFQRLYRTPPDQWTQAESLEWDCLLSHIDFEAYQLENRIPESRIGVVVRISAIEATIKWNIEGESTYDTREIPPSLITAPVGWVVHATIQRTARGKQVWLSAWLEPPLDSDDGATVADSSSAVPLSLDEVPDADWPRIEE